MIAGTTLTTWPAAAVDIVFILSAAAVIITWIRR